MAVCVVAVRLADVPVVHGIEQDTEDLLCTQRLDSLAD
jgi:hypothetical protein